MFAEGFSQAEPGVVVYEGAVAQREGTPAWNLSFLSDECACRAAGREGQPGCVVMSRAESSVWMDSLDLLQVFLNRSTTPQCPTNHRRIQVNLDR